MNPETLPAAVLRHDGEPCAGCGAPLAGDQRYCLHCGTRRADARLEFLDVLAADARTAAPGAPGAGWAVGPSPATGVRGFNGWLQQHSGALGLTAILLLTLIAGLLLGHWATGSGPIQQSAAPQVITVGGASAAAPAASTAAPPSDAASSGSSGSGSSGSSSSAKKGVETVKAPKDSIDVTKVTSDKKALGDALKKAKPISTGGTGKLPPKDDKAAAGGAGFETIG